MGSNLVAGFEPQSWMTQLVASSPPENNRHDWPVTKFVYPGAHDACTWGGGTTELTKYSWQCQGLNLYDQATKAGIRYFDIRITGMRTLRHGENFVGFHGLAKDTADTVLSDSETEVGEGTFIDQILKFLREQPGEIVILGISVDNTLEDRWVKTIANLLGEHILAPNSENGGRPTYNQAVQSNRRIIIRCATHLTDVPTDTRLQGKVWDCNDVGGNSWFPNDHRLYNDETWQSYEPEKVIRSVLDWASSNAGDIQKYDRFWSAQFQMTPTGDAKQAVLGFLGLGHRSALSPRALALGGGEIEGGGVTGGFNATVVAEPEVWHDITQYASVIQIDWAGVESEGGLLPQGNSNYLTDAIIKLNLSR